MDLRITNLSKTYPNGVRALDNVTMTIPTGMYGLLGPNGAGKSTLMRTIATLQEADSGSISLGDLDVLKEKQEVRVAVDNCRDFPTRSGGALCVRFNSDTWICWTAANYGTYRPRGWLQLSSVNAKPIETCCWSARWI